MTTDETPRDWRGTPITIGAPTIHGGPVGRSIELVEGVVEGFTKTGRVNIRVTRRAYTGASTYSKEVVHVGQDRLVVLNPDSLPPSELPTLTEGKEAAKERMAKLNAIKDTHDLEWVEEWAGGSSYRYKTQVHRCKKCGTSKYYTEECPR